MTPTPAAKPAAPATLAPVRLVETEFPAVAPSSSSATAAEPQPATRTVIPIGNAFPEATGSGSAPPVAAPPSEEARPSEQK
jgi:hypothetical protein